MIGRYEISHKTVHLLILFVPLLTYFSLPIAQAILFFFVFFYIYSEHRKVSGLPFFAHRFILKIQKEEERKIWAKAPLLLVIGVLISISFFSWKAAFIGIYQAGLCDTVAGVCGKKWGKTKLPFFSRKTYVGSLSFLIFALPVAFILLPPSKAIIIALVGAFLESLPFKDWDNLTVPLVVTFLAEQFMF